VFFVKSNNIYNYFCLKRARACVFYESLGMQTLLQGSRCGDWLGIVGLGSVATQGRQDRQVIARFQ